MKVAITGAAGYVGAHSTTELLSDGHTVRLLALPHEADVLALFPGYEDRIEVLIGDLRDKATVEELVDGCDALLQMTDVRDVAAVHAAVMAPGHGPSSVSPGVRLATPWPPLQHPKTSPPTVRTTPERSHP
ncbi:NAD-dependent epimerase/dehydratase family protein [Rhodococcus sp. NPDC058521]|uniref:NAD-dependent epimerase/dehydratase family protein n=1 Tax=Rhodococcus sp. NPDC058521 TaxID=3346536 RepID=UPI0036688A46